MPSLTTHAGRGIGRAIPGPTARLQPVVRRARRHVEEVVGAGQGPGDLLLHRHEALGLAGTLAVGAVVGGVPEPGAAGHGPGPVLELPGQCGGAAAPQDRSPGGGVDAAGRHQHAVAHGSHRLALREELDDGALDDGTLQIRSHAPRPMTPGEQEARALPPLPLRLTPAPTPASHPSAPARGSRGRARVPPKPCGRRRWPAGHARRR